MPALSSVNMSNLDCGLAEHALEGLVFQHAIEAAQHLGFGGGEFLAVEFGLKEAARRAFELFDVVAVFLGAARLHQIAQGVDGGVWDVEHQPGDIAKDHDFAWRSCPAESSEPSTKS